MNCPRIAAMEESVKSALMSLPGDAVRDLLSIGVCPRCIFRIFGVHGDAYSSSFLSPASLWSLLKSTSGPMDATKYEENIDLIELEHCQHSIQETQGRKDTCIVCLGILQIPCTDQKQELTMHEGESSDKAGPAVSIMEIVKNEGHHCSSFCLEVTTPPVVLIREHALLLYMKQKYRSEDWFEAIAVIERLSVKEALKLSLTKSVEAMLGVNSDVNSTFRIALVYKHTEASSKLDFIFGSRENNAKRRKAEQSFGVHNGGLAAIEAARMTANAGESFASVQRALNSMSEDMFAKHYKCPPEKVCRPCEFAAMCYRTSIYIGGRYLKYSRNVSQTCWMIDDERMGEASVEEIIGNVILSHLKGDSFKFHAAGREDIDVRMLGSGRPFLIEILNARIMPTKSDIEEMETKINNLKDGFVKVRALKEVGSDAWTLMREGEAEKQKQYAAVVWISRPLTDEDLKCISEIKELEIEQKTPIRVLHRRSPLVRKRLIHWMRGERINGSSQYFLLHLCTQAGTYIKEFVHGDLGRTYPNIGSLLGSGAEILQLDVTDVKMDCFD